MDGANDTGPGRHRHGRRKWLPLTRPPPGCRSTHSCKPDWYLDARCTPSPVNDPDWDLEPPKPIFPPPCLSPLSAQSLDRVVLQTLLHGSPQALAPPGGVLDRRSWRVESIQLRRS